MAKEGLNWYSEGQYIGKVTMDTQTEPIKYEPTKGFSLYDAVYESKVLSESRKKPVSLIFNNVKINVSFDDPKSFDMKKVMKFYLNKIKQR